MNLRDRLYVVGHIGARDQRLDFGKIERDFFVVLTAFVGAHRNKILFAALRRKEFADHLVRREDGCGRAHFRAHVRDRAAFRHFKRFDPFSGVLENLAEPAFYGEAPQHFKRDILGGAAGPQPVDQIDPDDRGHFQPHGEACHGDRHVHSARADCQHADRAARRRVAVRPQQRFARDAEAGIMDRMTDAVARARKVQPIFLCNGLQKNMIVRRLIVDIQKIVVQIAHGAFRADARKMECFKREV